MDNREAPKPPVIPKGMEDVVAEMEKLRFLHDQLRLLDRLPSCKRREDVRSALTEMLESPGLSYSALTERARNAFSQYDDVKNELSRVKTELANQKSIISDLNREIKELLMSRGPEPVEHPNENVSPPYKSSRFSTLGKLLLVMVLILVVYILKK